MEQPMSSLTPEQLSDAVTYIKGLVRINDELPTEPDWSEGLRLLLPDVIPLRPDYPGEKPVAWLIANDFNGYDLTTENPEEKSN
jgi:hypothetical protein